MIVKEKHVLLTVTHLNMYGYQSRICIMKLAGLKG